MEFDYLTLFFNCLTPVMYSGAVQFDDLFTLLILFGCFVIFCLGFIIGLLMLQV